MPSHVSRRSCSSPTLNLHHTGQQLALSSTARCLDPLPAGPSLQQVVRQHCAAGVYCWSTMAFPGWYCIDYLLRPRNTCPPSSPLSQALADRVAQRPQRR